MIVILKDKFAEVYTNNGKEIIPFDDIEDILDLSPSESITYVTQAVQTKKTKLISMIDKLNGNKKNRFPYKFIHATGTQTYHVTDCAMSFKGSGDCQIINAEVLEKIKGSMQVQQLLEDGVLEIIDERQMKKFVSQKKKNDKVALKKKMKSEQSIIMEDDISAVKAAEMGLGLIDGDSEIVSLDLEGNDEDMIEISDAELVERLKNGIGT